MTRHYRDDEYKVNKWFERDRANIELHNDTIDETVVEFWDEEVEQMIEDGFLDMKRPLYSLMNYALSHGLISHGNRKERLMPIIGGGKSSQKSRAKLKMIKSNPNLKELVKEHKQLVKHLAPAAKEYKKQKRELKSYKKKLKKHNNPNLGDYMKQNQMLMLAAAAAAAYWWFVMRKKTVATPVAGLPYGMGIMPSGMGVMPVLSR